MTSVLLIGATGPTGREILAQSRAAGLNIRAFVRNPASLRNHKTIEDISVGDVMRLDTLVAALSGVSVVVSALGTSLTLRHVTLLSEGTQNIVNAMRHCAVPRLISITGMGAGDSRGHGGFVYDHLILPTVLRQIYADKDRQERIVTESGLDWTLLRPARLKNGAISRTYRVLLRLDDQRMSTIARADVAHFVVKELGEHLYGHQTVNLSR